MPELEKVKEIKFTEREFNYLKDLLYNLSKVENKVPKSWKTEKSITLKQLNNRFSRMSFN